MIGSLGELVDRLQAEQGAALRQLKTGWAERAREMQGWLEVQFAAKPSPFGKGKLAQARLHALAWRSGRLGRR